MPLSCCRLLLLGLTIGLPNVSSSWAGDRGTLPPGLANLHNQTAQHRHARHTHRHAVRHRPCGVYPWRTPANCWVPTWGYSFFTPGFTFGVMAPSGVHLQVGGNYWLPPVHAPASLHFGPLANERFFGVHRGLPMHADLRPHNEELRQNLVAQEIAEKLRTSNATARQRAERFIEFGDNHFRQQRFHEAVQRYKSAIEAAPDVAEAYYHNAYALIAVKQYALALKAFHIALQLEPTIAHRDFQLEDLYGDQRLTMMSHLEALAQAANERPEDGGLLLLVAAFLHDTGQVERSQKFFERAVAKSPDLASLAAAFVGDNLPPDADLPQFVGQEHEI